MLINRREFIKKTLLLTSYGLTVVGHLIPSAWANKLWNPEVFAEKSYEESINTLFKDIEFIDSQAIQFSRLPRTAENGAVVPITISSNLENISKISIFVANNPHPLIAEFYLSPFVEARVSARFKMAKTSDVIVIIEADGHYYRKTKNVRVTVGGCGG